MTTFSRSFAIEHLTNEVLHQTPWFADLLALWRPAGDACRGETALEGTEPSDDLDGGTPDRLRLAIRNGYINFYRAGQSIAKVEFGRDRKLRARIHNKYVYGSSGSGAAYVTLTGAGYADQTSGDLRRYNDQGDLRSWITAANQHRGVEKEFVDKVVALNPNVIDLEMGLPSFDGGRYAPRMDLVVLEPADGTWRIAFWEAKRASDSRARCRGEDVSPHVIGQLTNYRNWLNHGEHRQLVARAYQNACKLLVNFHTLAAKVNPAIPALGAGIIAVAGATAPPLIDDYPRLLIDAREGDSGLVWNGHLNKLRSAPHDVQVRMVTRSRDMILAASACNAAPFNSAMKDKRGPPGTRWPPSITREMAPAEYGQRC